MRSLAITAVVFATLVTTLFGEEILRETRIQRIDPTTGLVTTETIRTRVDKDVEKPTVIHAAPVVAEPIVVNNAFPANPRDGEEVVVNGHKYEWDADDNRWELDD